MKTEGSVPKYLTAAICVTLCCLDLYSPDGGLLLLTRKLAQKISDRTFEVYQCPLKEN